MNEKMSEAGKKYNQEMKDKFPWRCGKIHTCMVCGDERGCGLNEGHTYPNLCAKCLKKMRDRGVKAFQGMCFISDYS